MMKFFSDVRSWHKAYKKPFDLKEVLKEIAILILAFTACFLVYRVMTLQHILDVKECQISFSDGLKIKHVHIGKFTED